MLRAFASGLALALLACQTLPRIPLEPPPRFCEGDGGVSDSVFLIGDAGAVKVPRGRAGRGADELVDPVLRSLRAQVDERTARLGERVTVVFLGDNVYPVGLAPEGERRREHGERVLRAQIESIGTARGFFIAGNHDWHREGPRGWEYILEEREFFEAYGPRITMQPPGGCAGPTAVDIGEYLRFVFLDVVGWGHAIEFPDQHRPHCPYQTALESFHALADEFENPRGRHVALLTHHPIVTAGPHGGHFTWKQHLFPLTDFWRWAWLPLPGIGSLYPIARQLGVTGTDTSSAIYDRYLRAILTASRPGVPRLVVAGHEHSLQLHGNPFGSFDVVSGAGSVSKVDRVEPIGSLLMGLAEPGFMRLDLHADGSLALAVFALHHHGEAEQVYDACLVQGPPDP